LAHTIRALAQMFNSYLFGLKPIAPIIALSNPPAKAGGNS